MVQKVHLDRSTCASSNAAQRDFSIWSASSSRIFRTASWPSLAERASVKSSTFDRSSRTIRSVCDCSEFHLSARRRAWFNSTGEEHDLIIQRDGCRYVGHLGSGRVRLISYRLVSLLPSGWPKPSPGWGRQPRCAAAGSPDANWTGCGSVAPPWEEEEEGEAPAFWTLAGQPCPSLNYQVCLWWGEKGKHTKNIITK